MYLDHNLENRISSPCVRAASCLLMAPLWITSLSRQHTAQGCLQTIVSLLLLNPFVWAPSSQSTEQGCPWPGKTENSNAKAKMLSQAWYWSHTGCTRPRDTVSPRVFLNDLSQEKYTKLTQIHEIWVRELNYSKLQCGHSTQNYVP